MSTQNEPSTSLANESSDDGKPNVRDLAKRFEAMSPIKRSPTKKVQTVRITKQKAARPFLTVSITNRPPPPPLRRKRSSKKRGTNKLSNSVTELRITTTPGPSEMAIRRKTSAKMKKSKSADSNIASFLTPLALTVETPKTILPTTNRPMTAKPQIPPKPTILPNKTMAEQPSRVSNMIQKRQEELAKLNLKPPTINSTIDKSPKLQRPKIPPPKPESAPINQNEVPLVRTNTSFKNRRRVIRKPSHKPPAPPINQKPKLTQFTNESNRIDQNSNNLFVEAAKYHTGESETSGQSETSLESSTKTIRCRLADGTEVPLLPRIPAPLPPQIDLFEDDSNGLYEEIEYEFEMKNRKNEIIPTGYTPKFERNSSDFCRSSHLDLRREESGPYTEANEDKLPIGTQTLGRSSAHSIVAALRSEKFFKNQDSMSTSVNNKSNQESWNVKKTDKRAISSLDVEKLSQIKSGFQSKMDWLKQKVTATRKSDTFSGRRRTDSGSQPSVTDSIDPRFYGDDWSSDDEGVEEVGDLDDQNYNRVEDEGQRFVAKNYECIDIQPPSKEYNSLLAEIESAYQEGRINKNSEDMMTEMTETENLTEVDLQKPPKSSNELQPNCFQNMNTQRFSLSANLLADSSLDTQSCCSSSIQEDDTDEENLKSFCEEMQKSTITEDSESLSDLEHKSLYESRLPVQQPLYQIYMLQEQKLLTDDSQLLKPPTIDQILSAPLNDEHEADSVCDSSNDTDDMASVSVRRQSSTASTDSGRGVDVPSSRVTSNTSMRRDRLTAGSAFGSQRSLWCELSEVKSAGLFGLNNKERKVQEAYFEVITSEASYLRSLNVLISNFVNAPELQGPKKAMSIITSGERKHLFSNIMAIRDCSESLLKDLETRLKENLVLTDVCDILSEHLEKRFQAIVVYCSNQVYQDRTLKRLKATNSQFLACLKKIELRRELHGLDLRSFLMLPMQRATRYRLLLFAILDHVPPNSPQSFTAGRALNLSNLLVQNCNEGARLLERTEQLLEIEKRLVYKSADLKRIPLVRKERYVVKSGQLMQFVERKYRPKINMLQTKQKNRALYLFLFSDLIMIANRKSNGTFVVKDYCYRRFIEIEPVEAHSHKVPISVVSSLPAKPHLFLLVLMQNARGKQSEFLLNADSETDRERWLSAIRPPVCSNPDEKIYASWDCPQVLCRHNYEASQEDELPLHENDLINVLRKMPDGWYFGEKVKDGKSGWFPCSYVQQVMNDHVRANNYRHRLRIIHAANDLQHQQTTADRIQDKRVSLAAIHTPQLKDRLRRLSNPKAFFGS